MTLFEFASDDPGETPAVRDAGQLGGIAPSGDGQARATVPVAAPAALTALMTLTKLRSGDAGHPLFIFCGTEISQAELAVVADGMRCGRPVWSLQAPATDLRVAGVDGLRESARQSLAAVRQVQPSGPHALCGYGPCGAMAFEVACELERAGQAPEIVCLVNAYLPVAQGRASGLIPLWLRARSHKYNASAAAPYQPGAYSATRVILVRSETAPAGLMDPAPAWRRAAHRGLDVICIPGPPADLAAQHGALIGLHLDAFLTPAPDDAEPFCGPSRPGLQS